MKAKRKDETELLDRLRLDGVALARAFGLTFKAIGKTRRDARIFGCCDTEGAIRIRLYSRTTGGFLAYSSLIATLCHELAHLRHFDHGADFKVLYRQLLLLARELGLYRTGSPALVPPVVDRTIRPALAASVGPRHRKGRRAPDPRQGTLFAPDDLAGLTTRRARRAGSARSPRRSR